MQSFEITITRACHVGGQLKQPATRMQVDSETAISLINIGRATVLPAEWEAIRAAERRREVRLTQLSPGHAAAAFRPWQ